MKTPPHRPACAGLLLGMLFFLAGCAPLRAPGSPDQSWVSLPISLAGIHDNRQAFAQVFQAELQEQAPADAAADSTHWLHLPAPEPLTTAAAKDVEHRFERRAAGTVVLTIPGLFGDCVSAQSVPFGDGQVRTPQRSVTEAYAMYVDLRLKEVRMLPLPGRASSTANGERLAEMLRAEAHRPGVERIVLVAYSKGVPDVLHALNSLQERGGIPVQIKALVSVAGVVMGSPLADHYERIYGVFSSAFSPLDCSPSEGGELTSLSMNTRLAWLASHPLPSSLRYYSVLAHAPSESISWPLRPFHAELSHIDPRNDGQVAASHAVLPGSTLLAEARADHWGVALPRDLHPDWWWRFLSAPEHFPRAALFRALVKRVVADLQE